jgi:hypothetical protein
MPDLWEYRDDRTGESLGSARFDTWQEANDHARRTFAGRPVSMRPAEPFSGSRERFTLGAVESITAPAQLAWMGARAIQPKVVRRDDLIRPPSPTGQRLGEGLARGAQEVEDARGLVARSLGMAAAPAAEEADLATSLGRAAGGLVYGPRSLANAAGSFGGEAADYAAAKLGMGPLGRMMASLSGDVGGAQLASGKNRAALAGAARVAANQSSVRAYRRLRVLDIVSDGAAAAIKTANSRASRMMGFEKLTWDRFDTALRKGLSRTGTSIDVATLDPSDLMREANFIWTKTPEEARGSLPDVVKSLVARSKKGGSAAQSMTLTDLRGFHEQINELWRAATSSQNTDPFLLGRATVADQLREPIMRAYESILAPQPSVANLAGARAQRGPTAGATAGTSVEALSHPTFVRPNRAPTLDKSRLGDVEMEQANALRVALEASRSTGDELNRLRSIGAGIGSGVELEPRKVIEAIVSGKKQIESPEIARDFANMVKSEDPKGGQRILAQTYYDYVLGEGGDFTTKQALTRLNGSRAVGAIWAGEEKMKALEQTIRWVGDKNHPRHPFAIGTVSHGLGLTAAIAFSGGRVPSDIHGLATGVAGYAAGYAAGEAIPRFWAYVRDNFGEEGQRMLARELLLDRDRYLRAERIAQRMPSKKDLEWVAVQTRAAILRQSNNASTAIQQQVLGR